MRPGVYALCLTSAILGMAAGPLQAQDQPKPAEFSDQAVAAAIEKGVAYLWSQQAADGSWGANFAGYTMGPTALVTYALLEAGVNPQDPRMAKTLKLLETMTDPALGADGTYSGSMAGFKTYSLGLRCNVWLSAMKSSKEYEKLLRRDVDYLMKSTADGSYWYDINGTPAPTMVAGVVQWDNSNSQYGLLGVWAGAQGGLEIPRKYWELVMKHWFDTQCSDGGWTYNGSSPTGTATMTAAGVASMFVCFDNLFSEAFVKCNVNAEFKPIDQGLKWLDTNFADSLTGTQYLYYYLYGVERAGLASGFKYFGASDWYKMGATTLIRAQGSNGSWTATFGENVNTAFALLFLVRGRHAVLFNKIVYDGDWNNRPRDLAALTRWISRNFETTVNWQIINLQVPVREWHDAPILYLSGAKEPKFTDEQIEKLRTYVLQGGVILSTTQCGGSGFSKGIRETYKRMFPDAELLPCDPLKHDIYTVYYNLRGKPRFFMLTNKIRTLALHTDEDISLEWQVNNVARGQWAFEAAANVVSYLTDKSPLRARGTSLWPEEEQFTPDRTIKLARLKFNGNFDPEPLAYQRFSRLLAKDTGTRLQVLGPMAATELAAGEARIATLTGVGELTLTPEEKDALKDWVNKGGTLIVDAAGGNAAFAESAEKTLQEIFGQPARRLASGSPIYQLDIPGAKDLKIDRVKYRRRTAQKINSRDPSLRAIYIGSRIAVIYSREDFTAGLVGYPSFTVDGYDPGDSNDFGSAYRVLRNAVLYAWTQLPDALKFPPTTSSAPATQPATAPTQPAAPK